MLPKRFAESNLIDVALEVLEVGEGSEPLNYNDVLTDENKKNWQAAMDEEMNSLRENDTWKLVEKPKNRKLVGCKWIYKLKPGIPGVEEPRYKARLVAKGFSQKEGIDYTEIFSPVVKLVSIRYLMSIVVQEQLELEQLDVKTAFLHGELEEEIYMAQPEGYVAAGKENLVCLLNKSLYGLKQSPRQWNSKFNSFMMEIGFKRSIHDTCVYIKEQNGMYLYLLLYVDDMLVACRDMEQIEVLKSQLSKRFSMKDLGNASKILGIDIIRDRKRDCLILSQENYLEKVLKRYNMHEAKGVQSPMGSHIKLSAATKEQIERDAVFMETVPYQSVVGSLMYGMTGTRPDLAYPVGLISRYMSNPVKVHWEAVKWVLRYVRGTVKFKLKFKRSMDFKIAGFCDSDYAADLDKRRSITGYAFQAGGNIISWKSNLQKVVALSTTEAEFMAMNAAAKEAKWLQGLAAEFGYKQKVVQLYSDSQSAIALAKNNVYHERTKHMVVKLQFVREQIEFGVLQVLKVHTSENPSDIFTKVLPSSRLKDLLSLLGVVTG